MKKLTTGAHTLKIHSFPKAMMAKNEHMQALDTINTTDSEPLAILDQVCNLLAPLAVTDKTGHILMAIEQLEAAEAIFLGEEEPEPAEALPHQ